MTRRLGDLCDGVEHIGKLGLSQAKDIDVWTWALDHEMAMVTMDSDFAEISGVLGCPPKLIWFRCGNQLTEVVEAKLRASWLAVLTLFNSAECVLEIV